MMGAMFLRNAGWLFSGLPHKIELFCASMSDNDAHNYAIITNLLDYVVELGSHSSLYGILQVNTGVSEGMYFVHLLSRTAACLCSATLYFQHARRPNINMPQIWLPPLPPSCILNIWLPRHQMVREAVQNMANKYFENVAQFQEIKITYVMK
jgi:hypothetical protein